MSLIPDSDAILAQFHLVMAEVLQGEMQRSRFQPWEIDLLLDIADCNLRRTAKRKILQEYQNAVEAELKKGASLPPKFSEYAERRAQDARTLGSKSGLPDPRAPSGVRKGASGDSRRTGDL
jgi:hypothetical protein